MRVAVQIIVSGRVQGVGYRYFAEKNARACDICGYVKNLYDGRVEVVAEGIKEQVDAFIDRLKQGPVFGNVDRVEVRSLPYENRYDSFHVAY